MQGFEDETLGRGLFEGIDAAARNLYDDKGDFPNPCTGCLVSYHYKSFALMLKDMILEY